MHSEPVLFKSQSDRWRQRFCVLTNTHICLFKDQSIGERPMDIVRLESVIKVTFSPRTKLLNAYTKEHTVTFELSSNKIDGWVRFFAQKGIPIIGEEDPDNIRIDINPAPPKPVIQYVSLPPPHAPPAKSDIGTQSEVFI